MAQRVFVWVSRWTEVEMLGKGRLKRGKENNLCRMHATVCRRLECKIKSLTCAVYWE